MVKIDDIRNIVLLGHGGSGKTSLAEAILHKTGTINRLGAIEDKSTVCDYDDEEKQRGHSIHSALAHANYGGKLINIIDTPGYPDFVGAALLPIPAAEAAVIVVGASSGIEMNTRKLFDAATKAGKPRIIVINKMDAENADLGALVGTLQETFGSCCRCANLCAADKASVIDCLAGDQGDSAVMDVAQGHTELIESIVEADDDLMESYLGGEEISKAKIAEVFVKALVEGTIVPIVFT
ncbi:MAG: elongation factor G, partial [Planctomycetota bacterium]